MTPFDGEAFFDFRNDANRIFTRYQRIIQTFPLPSVVLKTLEIGVTYFFFSCDEGLRGSDV